MQCSIYPVQLVQDEAAQCGVNVRVDVGNVRYATNNDGDDYRNCNRPEVGGLRDGGQTKAYVLLYNWDINEGNNNTERFAQCVGPKGEPITTTGEDVVNGQVRVAAYNNDNACITASGGGCDKPRLVGPNTWRQDCNCGANGNGKDDTWANTYEYKLAEDGSSCEIKTVYDVSIGAREERSRGTARNCDLNGDGKIEDEVVHCYTQGNSQPMREGVWCTALINGEKIWSERIAHRGETPEGKRAYASRIKFDLFKDMDKMAAGLNANTCEGVVQFQMHRGNNNMNRKGGYSSDILAGIVNANEQGLNFRLTQSILPAFVTGGGDVTHAQMWTTWDWKGNHVLSLATGNHNGNKVAARVINSRLGADLLFVAADATTMGSSYDHQYLSKALGNNPRNQGRNKNDCDVEANPFVNAEGKSKNLKTLNICAWHTSPDEVGLKGNLAMEIFPPQGAPCDGVNDPTATGGGEGNGEGNGNGNGNGNGEGNNGGTSGGAVGCSSAGGFGGALVFLLVVLAVTRRRQGSF